MADARDYVRARAAAANGEVAAAAVGYGAVLAQAPDDAVVAIRAYRNALAAGDMALARQAAAILVRADAAPADVALLQLADAVRTKDRAGADDALGRIGPGPLDFLAPVLRAWVTLDRGGDPLPLLDSAAPNPLGRHYVAEHRALLLIAMGRIDEGVAALRLAVAAEPGSIDLRWNAANLLAGKGKKGIALAVLAGDDPVMTGLRARLGRGVKPGAAFGIGRAFTRLASDLSGERTYPLSILLTRAALSLDPRDDRARLLLAEALVGDEAFAQARETLDAVPKGSPFYDAALGERVELRRTRGDVEGAIALAASLADARDARDIDVQRYADLLANEGREAEAARVYARLVERADGKAGWSLLLQLGGALERSGRWDAALPHLRRAVELAPEQPLALNYLGYALVERGESLDEATALLERARSLRPDSAAITDSLGWAYFMQRDYAKALPLLEKAAEAEPASANINEHLGDVYWAMGRRYEARYAWRAAAIYADGGQKARITAKMLDGPVQRTAAN
ncbi:tetratricopeptide repeat protein [Sphingomonas sp.]|uniref:tetratricopeptide repeat protein n=1 Tax=Sphingomonas sp. TaxID=28214 RepID=UPI001ED28503|nr:tetratricopeptide repeat protein [Sphingomonas sp.]MBX3595119.1 tetratricopeptide repeat protein [Sphingomonas sp.]